MMSEESLTEPTQAEPAGEDSAAAVQPQEDGPHATLPSQPETAGVPPESAARVLLRAAIDKVMKEIEHHEAEAQRHLRLAATLREDLRESIAFLRKQGGQKEAAPIPGPIAFGEPNEKAPKEEAIPGEPPRKRLRVKRAGRKPPGRKGKT